MARTASQMAKAAKDASEQKRLKMEADVRKALAELNRPAKAVEVAEYARRNVAAPRDSFDGVRLRSIQPPSAQGLPRSAPEGEA